VWTYLKTPAPISLPIVRDIRRMELCRRFETFRSYRRVPTDVKRKRKKRRVNTKKKNTAPGHGSNNTARSVPERILKRGNDEYYHF